MAVFVAFAACVLIWGSTWYGIEFQLGVVAKEWSLFYRFGLAAVLLIGWCLIKGYSIRFDAKGHVAALGTGALLFGLNYLFVYAGTEYLTSGLVAVAFSTLSLMNIFTSRLFLKAPIQLPVLLAALIGVIGLALIFSHEMTSFSLSDETALGLGLCLLATLTASIGNTIPASDTAKSFDVLPFTALALLYSSAFNLMIAIVSGEPILFDANPPYVIALIYLASFGTVVAFTLYLWLISKIGVARAGYIAVMTPLVALTISTFYEGFTWDLTAVVGLALIMIGNGLMVRLKATKTTTNASNKAA
ncbi:DMT family transporter [Kordiimonas aquimaris]|uniref:DMT family transporter n=1 Tax=Kordiimonas aquimaris TaxID=707591 RepID=UPI0021CFB223|nr:DMT family transporter [Kordiimonas aquimaris]